MFIVLISTQVPDHLRGYLSRFIVEVEAGVFTGRVSRAVADRLWERCCDAVGEGRLTLIQSDSSAEQGFSMRTNGTNPARVVDMDGLQLVARRQLAEKANVLG